MRTLLYKYIKYLQTDEQRMYTSTCFEVDALKKRTLLHASRTVIVWISGENKHCQWHKSMIRKIATDILRGNSE